MTPGRATKIGLRARHAGLPSVRLREESVMRILVLGDGFGGLELTTRLSEDHLPMSNDATGGQYVAEKNRTYRPPRVAGSSSDSDVALFSHCGHHRGVGR